MIKVIVNSLEYQFAILQFIPGIIVFSLTYFKSTGEEKEGTGLLENKREREEKKTEEKSDTYRTTETPLGTLGGGEVKACETC